ncbi:MULTISPECIES: TolC family protein [unclassified Cupriavidus]|uniref:TolC family protein n=1 Tax=Cupriavidus sp. H19C3 TaxID=3241603 RepID=UPI003BF88AAE
MLASVCAQTPPTELRALFDAAWDRSVALQATNGRRQEAAASRVQADSLIAGPPSLDLRHRGDQLTQRRGVRESEIAVGVPIWMPGQRSARGALADAQAAEAESAVTLGQLAVAAEVRERVWQLAAATSEREVLQRRVGVAQSLRDDVRRRLAAGDLARTDLLFAEQDLLASQTLLAESDARLVEARARLLQTTGSDALPARYEEVPVSGNTGTPHPQLDAAQRAVERNERQVGYLQASRRDPPEVGVTYRRDAAGGGFQSDQTIGVFIRIPFATDARNLPRETAAQTELMTARAQRDRTERVVQSDIDAARQSLGLAEQQLALVGQRSQTLAERAALLRKTFNAGEIGLPEVLRAQNQALEAETDLARVRARRGLAIANLNQAMGVLP